MYIKSWVIIIKKLIQLIKNSPEVGQTVSTETINSYSEPTFSVKPYIYNN